MMLGSGFLRQMNETIKYNRDLLRKKSPFEKDKSKGSKGTALIDDKKLSNKETEILINQIKLESRRQGRRQILIFFISVAVTVILLLIFKETLLKSLIDFLK
jgi:hypothetical protein